MMDNLCAVLELGCWHSVGIPWHGAWVLAQCWHTMACLLWVIEVPCPLLGTSPFHPQATTFVSCYSPDTGAWKFCGLPFLNSQFYKCPLNILSNKNRELPKITALLSCIQIKVAYKSQEYHFQCDTNSFTLLCVCATVSSILM